MPRDLIAGPAAPYRERSTYYRGGGKGGGGAFGRRSLTDADFEAALPQFADAYLGSGLGPTPQDLAAAKLKLMMGGTTPYNPEDFAGVRPKSKVPQIVVKKAARIAQAVTREIKRRGSTTGTSRSSTYGSGIRGGGMGSSYGSRGYQGGTYGGAGGRSITEGVGGAFKNR